MGKGCSDTDVHNVPRLPISVTVTRFLFDEMRKLFVECGLCVRAVNRLSSCHPSSSVMFYIQVARVHSSKVT